MKDYMVTHTFKSEEIRQQYFAMSEEMDEGTVRSQMKNENASFEMNWNAGRGQHGNVLLVEGKQLGSDH